MRYILGFCAVLAVASLTGTAETAYGYQASAAGRVVPPLPPPAAAAATAAENALQVNPVPAAANTPTPGATTAGTTNAGQAAAAGRANTTIPGTTAPASGYQA